MLGQFVPYIKAKFGLTLAAAGMLSTLQSIGGMLAVFVVITFIDTFNKPKAYGIAGLFFSFFLAIVGIIPWLTLVCILFLLLGFISCMINTLPNAIISDLVMEKRGLYLNLLHAFFGVGGIIGSQLTSLLASKTDMGITFIAFAGLVLFCVAVYLVSVREELRSPLMPKKISVKHQMATLKSVFRKKGMFNVLLIAFFCAFGMLNVLYWTYTYISGLGAPPALAAFGLTFFFVGLAISRFIAARLTTIAPNRIILFGSLAGFIINLVICLSYNPVFVIALFGLLGFFIGSSFPQIFIISCSIAPKNTAIASGVVAFGFFVASFIAPPLVGWIGDLFELRYGLLLNAVMFIPTGLLALRFRKNEAIPAVPDSSSPVE